MGMHGAARSRLQPWLLALTSHTQALHPLLAAASPLCVHDTCLAATGVCAAAGLGLCATGRQHAAEAAPGDLRRVQQPPLYLPAAHEHSCWGAGSEPHGSQQSGEGGGRGWLRLVATGGTDRQGMLRVRAMLPAAVCAAQHTTRHCTVGVSRQVAKQPTCTCVVVPACLVCQVVFDPSWNPAHDLQAQDRAYRLGQTRDVAVYRLVGTGDHLQSSWGPCTVARSRALGSCSLCSREV